MRPFVRRSLFCFALVLILPFAASASTEDGVDTALAEVSQDEVAMTLDATPANPEADQSSPWLAPPEWTKNEVTQSFGSCPGPPVLSCQCGPGFGEPGSEDCCYCNTCWDGYVLALCGLDP